MKNQVLVLFVAGILIYSNFGCQSVSKTAGSGSFNGNYALQFQPKAKAMHVVIWEPTERGQRIIREANSLNTIILVLKPNQSAKKQEIEVMFIDKLKLIASDTDKPYQEKSYVLDQNCLEELTKYFRVILEESNEAQELFDIIAIKR